MFHDAFVETVFLRVRAIMTPIEAHDQYCPDRGRVDHVGETCQVFIGMILVAKGVRRACIQIAHEVHPADGVEGCGCSSEIIERIEARLT